MNFDIIFSICVHENYDVCINQFSNYRYFSTNSLIIVHVNESVNFTADELKERVRLSRLSNVIISDKLIKLQWGCGRLIYAHCLNYSKIIELNFSFKYFVIDSSNSMLYRHGINDHIDNFDCGYSVRSALEASNFTWDSLIGGHWERTGQYGLAIQNDRSLIKLIADLNIKIYCGNHEGTFMSMKVSHDFFQIFEKYFEPTVIPFYPSEEIWVPTLLTYIQSKYNLKITKSYIRLAWPARKGDLQLQVVNQDIYKNSYGIKQVVRDIKDPARIELTKMVNPR